MFGGNQEDAQPSVHLERRIVIVLCLLAALHFVLALAYAADTPYRTPGVVFGQPAIDIGAPDELQHVNYVRGLMDTGSFPVFDPNDPKLGEHYQSHQPPLFYLVAAGYATVFGQHDLTTKSAGMVLRSLDCLIGGANVVGVFFLGWWGLRRKEVALFAAAFAALLPMNLAVSGAVSNDPLLYCLCTWCLAVTALGLSSGWTLKRALTVGLLMGLALLTKTTSLSLVPALLISAYLSKASRPSLRILVTAAFPALLIALPWWLRNQHLYGDPLAIKAFNQAFVGNPTRTSLGLGWYEYAVNWVGWWTARSFVGVFGYMNVFLSDTFYRISLAILLSLALGAFLALGKPEWKPYRAAHILNGTFLLFVLLSFAAFNVRYFQGQARYLFPAIGPISIGFGVGLVYFSRERWRTSAFAWTLVLAALNLYIVSDFLKFKFRS